MERIKAFKQSKKYTMRQTFLIMCESVFVGDKNGSSSVRTAEDVKLFVDYFLASFVELQSDKIVNVRLQVCQALALLFEMKSELCNNEKIINMVNRLRTDSAKDSIYFLRKIELPQLLSSPDKAS